TLTVLLKPGVMDPAAQSVLAAAQDLGIRLESVRTFRRYFIDPAALEPPTADPGARDTLRGGFLHKVLANDAIEQVIDGPLAAEHLSLGTPYAFRLAAVPLRDLDDAALLRLSRDRQLSLSR